MIGTGRVQLAPGAAGPAEHEVRQRFPGESAVKRHTAARVAIAAREILHAQKVAAEFQVVSAADPGEAAGVLVVVERPDFGGIVGGAEDNVSGSFELGKTAGNRVAGASDE